MNNLKRKTIWIDIDNAPHVQIFTPIIEALNVNYNIIVTAKEYGQNIALLDFKNISYFKIGCHPGKIIFLKIFGTIYRALQLVLFIKGRNVDLSICHGSRALIIASWLLQIKSIIMFDYEFSEKTLKSYFGKYLLVPKILEKNRLVRLGYPLKKLNEYPGIKENIYIPFFKPDSSVISRLNLQEDKITILFRPPSDISHYNHGKNYDIALSLLEYLQKFNNLQIIVLLRYSSQKKKYNSFINNPKIIFPLKVEDGLNLIYHSDLVISGGGTMNREAAVMNVPVYSIFKGEKAKIDTSLEEEGKLKFIDMPEDFSLIKIVKKINTENKYNKETFNFLIKFIQSKLQ
jgi:uncharacterized protein